MPTKIGRFEIQGQLSRSAFATVYKALDTETKQVIALKAVALNNLPDRDALVKTVFEEADRSKPLNSHNIAVLFGVGDEEGQLLAGAEYVQGTSVATTLARKDGFSICILNNRNEQSSIRVSCNTDIIVMFLYNLISRIIDNRVKDRIFFRCRN